VLMTCSTWSVESRVAVVVRMTASAGHRDGPSARCSRTKRSCRRRSARRGGDGPRAAGAQGALRLRPAASACTARRQQRRCNGDRSKEKTQKANAARHDETPNKAAGKGGTRVPRPTVSRQLC